MKNFNLSLVAILAMGTFAVAGGDIVIPVEEPVAEGLVMAGVVGIGIGNQKADSTDYISDGGMTYEVFAKLSIPFLENFSTQIDIQSEHYNIEGDGYQPLSTSALGLHLSYRDPSFGLIGAYYTRAYAHVKGTYSDEEDGHGYLAGIEGQYYINDMFTVYGQIGKGDIVTDDDPEGFVDGQFWSVALRAFLLEDTLVELSYSEATTDQYIDGDDKGEFSGWSAKVESKLMDSQPLYGYISYRSNKYDATTEGDEGTDKTVMVGLTYRFGVSSLRHNDRFGATLDQPMLPVRGASFAEGLD